MQHDKKPVPDWLLERLALGELDADTAADVRRRLAAEGRSPDDVMAAVATSNRELLAEHGATPTVAAIRQRAARTAAAERPARKRSFFLWAAARPRPRRRRRAGVHRHQGQRAVEGAAALRLQAPR
jgi:hypothetical protein